MATRTKARPLHHGCQVMRRALIRRELFNLATGELTPAGEAWETKPCSVPLFSDAERASGECRSCAAGWTHPHNYRVDQAEQPAAAAGA